MRTTIDLPDSLIEEAMKWSHQKTKTSVIITALEEYVRKKKLQALKEFRGKVSLDINIDTLRNRV